MRYRPLSYAIAVLCSQTALAAEQTGTLDEVLVSATRPGTTLVGGARVAPTQIQTLAPATSDTATLLRDVPGLSFQTGGGVSSLPVLRGLADDRLRTVVDGMSLIAACPNHMNPAMSYIDPSAVESIQVYQGVSPVSVGGDSIGGSIVVESAKPKFAASGEGLLKTGEVGAHYRSNGDAQGANANLTIANENLSLRYTGATAKSDNYKAAKDFKAALFGNAANSPYTGRAGHTLALDEVGSTAYESSNHTVALAWRNADHLVDFSFTRQDIPFENFVNQRMDMTKNESDKFNLAYEGQMHWGTLKARAYHETTDHEMDFGADKRYWYGTASGGTGAVSATDCSAAGLSSTCAAGMPMYTKSKTDGLNLNGEIFLSGEDTLRVGLEFQAYTLDDWWPESGSNMLGSMPVGDESFWNLNKGERDRYALFGEWEKKWSQQWTGLFGLRYEMVKMNAGDVRGYDIVAAAPGSYANTNTDATFFNSLNRSKTDHNLDMTALAKFVPDDTRAFEFGIAQKTRSPNLYERYAWSSWQMAALMNNTVGDGNGYFGNVDLKPEVAHTLNITGDWHAADKRWGVKASPYYSHVKDYIDAVQWSGDAVTGTARTTNLTNQYSVLRYINQSARLYGLDLSAYTQVAKGTGFGDFTVAGQINWVDGENRDTGDNLYNLMPLNGRLALTQKWGAWSSSLEGVFVSGKDDVSSVRNELKTSGYSLFNLRASYEWKQVRLDFGVENLLDRAYDLPLGGAYVGQGTTMTLATTPTGVVPMWGTGIPGPARSLYIGGTFKF